MDSQSSLSPLAQALIRALIGEEHEDSESKISVNPLVSKVAQWYEKLRNAMDYREEEVVLRAAIERILKRRLLIGIGSGKKVAEPLVRELAWAHYFKENTLSQTSIDDVGRQIDLYLALKSRLQDGRVLKEGMLNEWIFHLMSSSIERALSSRHEKELVNNFMYQIMRANVEIPDDSEQTRDAQVFIAVRRSFAKDDLAFLRYHLFQQYFGKFGIDDVDRVAQEFPKAYREIQKELLYPRKEAIYSYIKRKTSVFFILEDILTLARDHVVETVTDSEKLQKMVFDACSQRYGGISSKVHRALFRSVLFILLTKVFFAFAVEGTYESLVYGQILWGSIAINTSIPPLLMVIVGLFIRAPGRENSQKIFEYIKSVLFSENPVLGQTLRVSKMERKRPLMYTIFTLLWLLAFLVSFGIISFVLTKLHFNIVSQGIFLFFLAIVSFLSYRILLMSDVYRVDQRQGWLTPLIDFFFMPIVRVGSYLTEGISQVNIFLFILDFIIETPFKGLFGFFEQWFVYLHTKREGLE